MTALHVRAQLYPIVSLHALVVLSVSHTNMLEVVASLDFVISYVTGRTLRPDGTSGPRGSQGKHRGLQRKRSTHLSLNHTLLVPYENVNL